MAYLDREITLKTLRGYAEVNRITQAERRARLRRLTDDEARDILDRLYHDPGKFIAGEDQTRLMNIRLQHHLKVRKAMAKLAQVKGYESAL